MVMEYVIGSGYQINKNPGDIIITLSTFNSNEH